MGGLNINIFGYIPWSGIGYIELLLLYFGEISTPNSTVGASFFTGPSNKQGFFIPYAPRALLSFVFLVLDILTMVRWNFILVSFVYLMNKDFEHTKHSWQFCFVYGELSVQFHSSSIKRKIVFEYFKFYNLLF